MLRTLDLFSGIGGFSYALRSVAKTVAYCEIDPACQAVLRANMKRRTLHKAPIFDDITKITPDQVKKLRPDMITAGFPCQDISVANPSGKGLKGSKSGLYKEVLRLVDAAPSVKLVLMENSSRILKVGFKTLRRAMEARGFVVGYVLVRASDVGALHKRLRWYCLCHKPGAQVPRKDNHLLMGFDFLKAMRLAKVARLTKENKVRCMMLGNSVVPQCVWLAWKGLTSKTCDGTLFRKAPKLRLTFTDGNNKIVKDRWATPVHSIWHNYRSLTPRGSRLLSNQTFYYEGRIDRRLYNKYVANPAFVENLMGYPRNWTRAS